MRFSFSSGSFPTFSLPALFELGLEAGADAVEVMLTPRLVGQGSTRLRFLEEGSRLPIASLHSVIRIRPASLEQTCQDIIDSARLAARLEHCRALVVHLPPANQESYGIDARWLDAVQRANEILVRGSAKISIENPDPPAAEEPCEEWLSLTRWRVLAQEFGWNLTLDTSHAALSGWDLLTLAETFPQEIDNVHLSDVGGRWFRSGLLNSLLHQHRPPGTGQLELERFLARLAQTTFSGLITLEISPLRVPLFWLPSAARTLESMLQFCRQSTGDVRERPVRRHVRRASSLDR